MSITKIQASILYGYGYTLKQVKTGYIYKVDKLRERDMICSCLTISERNAYVDITQIGTDYLIMARTISELTKEIKGVGMPIVELYNMSNDYCNSNLLDYEFVDSWGAGKILKVWNNKAKDDYTEFIYHNQEFRKDRRYSKGSDAFGIDLPTPIRVEQKIKNQLALFQWLYTNHFAVDIPEELITPI